MPSTPDIGERIRALGPGSAIALRLDPLQYPDHYVAALSASLRDSSADGAGHTIFVSVTNPASLVWSLAQALDVPGERLSFVDAISHIMMNYRDPLPNATYLESPRMLEGIMLRVEYLLRKRPGERAVVVLDSVNSLAIHNPPDLLSEFFHIMVNNLKARQVLTIIFVVPDENSTQLDQMLSLVVDESIEVGRGGA
jgi:KaiC/GvpD/RAD55 family RecA-like ATPase